jgi:transposase
MARPKGGKSRTWTKEEKLRIVRRYFDEGIGSPSLAKEEHISDGMIRSWIRKYLDEGEDSLENKRKTGNQFAALHTSKSLSELERLRLTVAKQEIEIERLKKGYIVKGAGANKEFVTTKDASTKS